MRPKPRKFTVDWFSDKPGPKAGDFVRHCAHEGRVLGLYKIVGSRQIRVRVSRGETARFSLSMERVEKLTIAETIHTIWNNAPRPKKPDRFSPLL